MFALMNTPAEARVKALSRANCLGFVNESITYDRPDLQPFMGTAVGVHAPWGALEGHQVTDPNNAGDNEQWRYYAGDVGDAATVTVYGFHTWYKVDAQTGELVESGSASTLATDCNLTEW
jgi:hypothetical protein